jgi:hypothetical protein
MAEDNMEIVIEPGSAHMLDSGETDDFLEIDIDLPPGFTEEDHTIEDAPQMIGLDEAGAGISFDNTDDYMLDDDHQELSYETNDELMYEEEREDHEAPSHSYVNVADPVFTTFVGDSTPRSNGDHQTETFPQAELAALTTTSVSLDTTRMGSPTREDADDAGDVEEITENQINDDEEDSSHINLEHGNDDDVVYHDEAIDRGDEDGTMVQEPWDENNAEEFGDEVVTAVDVEDANEERRIDDEPGLRQIKVLYKNAAYDLFDNGSGDPDQYFLDDIWLSVEPLSAILQGIRNVLEGELDYDHEICLRFQEFGLETEEVSHPLLKHEDIC